jgi:hypothetical protein
MMNLLGNQIETIDFRTFCKNNSPVQQKNSISHRHISAYSIYINPLAFFDVHFILATGCVVLVAVLEKKLADNGIIGAAAVLSGVLRLSLPIVSLGSILYLISHLGVFL